MCAVPRRSHPPVPQIEVRRRFGRRIRQLRLARGLSQGALGAPHFDRQYVSGIELGVMAPSFGAILHFARKLGIPLSRLVHGIDPAPPRKRG